MTRVRDLCLVCRALLEFIRYDVRNMLSGFDAATRRLGLLPATGARSSAEEINAIVRAVQLAGCLYWKTTRCLQRSVCAVRLMRARGVPATLVIGYRPVPFTSHAWVEVDGRVVNDSPAYRKRLLVLYNA